MKRPNPEKSFDVDSFIGGAATVAADRPHQRREKKGKSATSKEPAAGFTRASFDLPDDLHIRLKVAAAKAKMPMRDLVQEGIEVALRRLGL